MSTPQGALCRFSGIRDIIPLENLELCLAHGCSTTYVHWLMNASQESSAPPGKIFKSKGNKNGMLTTLELKERKRKKKKMEDANSVGSLLDKKMKSVLELTWQKFPGPSF